jgi:hypothetical protein
VLVRVARHRSSRKPIVLGMALARAAAAEEKRQERHPGLPKLLAHEYDFWTGDFDLLAPVPAPADADARALSRTFAESDQAHREKVRSHLSMDELYTLLAFANRSAAFALQSKDETFVADGLVSLAMIDPARIDLRDLLVSAGLLHHAAVRVAPAPSSLFRSAMDLAEPVIAQGLGRYIENPARFENLPQTVGYQEVDGPLGPGFVSHGLRPFDPSFDFVDLLTRAEQVIDADHYKVSAIVIADELPWTAWFRPEGQREAAPILKRARGVGTFNAKVRPASGIGRKSQILIFFLMELATEADAVRIMEIAAETRLTVRATLPILDRRLFALLVSSAVYADDPMIETTKTLQRFKDPLQRVLSTTVAH